MLTSNHPRRFQSFVFVGLLTVTAIVAAALTSAAQHVHAFV